MPLEKINQEFVNELRLYLGTLTWSFDGSKETEIVPSDLTHQFLLKNFKIDNSILDFYYSHSNRFFTNEDYQKLRKTGYVGRKEYTLNPYPFIIFGAYFNRIDLMMKIKLLSWQSVEERPKLNGKSVEYFADLVPYFKEYAEGFKIGYESFEEKCINKYLPHFPDKSDFINKVFEYITKSILFEHDWYNNHSGFAVSFSGNLKNGKIVNALENGQQQGYFYKAWCIVFSNNILFAPLFQERIKIKALPPQPIKTKAEILKEQLSQYGFFELEKVKALSEQKKDLLVEKIAESGLPYAIAMFDYLQFIQYLEKKHFDSKYKLNREVSKWFDSDKEGRAVKGNISSLLKNTTENKDRYTAYKHKENVIKDYELLK